MSQILLTHPSQSGVRELIVTELIKGGWFRTRENVVRLLSALKLGSRLSGSLVEPAHHLFSISWLDYNTMLKIALAHWMRKAQQNATLTNLSNILKRAGFVDAGMMCRTQYGSTVPVHNVQKFKQPDGNVRRPANGKQLEYWFDQCQSDDTILLQPNTEYHGSYDLCKDNITLCGADGSRIVGTKMGYVLNVEGNGCTISGLSISDNGEPPTTNQVSNGDYAALNIAGDGCTVKAINCSGALGVAVHGSRCNITGLNLNGCGLRISGDDNDVQNAVVNGNKKGYSVEVRGSRNRIEGLTTKNCRTCLYTHDAAKDCSFVNCTFDSDTAAKSWIDGDRGVFVGTDFVHGVSIDVCLVSLEACGGRWLEVTPQSKIEIKDCRFPAVETTCDYYYTSYSDDDDDL